LYVFVVVAAWRARRAFGVAALAVGLVVGLALMPSYLTMRNQTSGAGPLPGAVLIASDEYRLQAWGAASRMFLDQPVTGQGFLAYRELSVAYGDVILRSPHNEWLRYFAEGGFVMGMIGLAFVLITTRCLYRVPGWLGAGLTAGFLGYVLAASFNNPLLFLRVSAVAFPVFGVGLALAERYRANGRASDQPTAPAGEPPPDAAAEVVKPAEPALH
jgi:O-antigen ligase